MDHPFMTTKNVYDNAIAVDESSFLKRDMPRRGWALGASAVPKPPPKHHRERVSLILAIDKSGVVASQMKKGSFNTQSYASFLQSLPVGSRIIADNVAFHKSRHVREVAEANNQELVYTPPYCPWFNPTEFAFSVTKHAYRRSRLEHGSDFFEEDVANALDSLSESKCDAFFRHAANNVSLELQLAANEHRGLHS
jgi:transposase